MSNEEFQKLVLEKFDSINNNLKSVIEKVDRIEEATKLLYEFKTETTGTLKEIRESQKSTHEILGRHDEEITTLKRKTG